MSATPETVAMPIDDGGVADDVNDAEAVGGRQRLGRNIAALGAGQLFTWSMTLAWTVVVPRIIGPSGLGLIVTGMAVTGILQIVVGMGSTSYVVREIVVNRGRLSELVSTAIAFRLLLAPAFVAGVLLWSHFAHYGNEGTVVLYLIAAAALLNMLTDPIQGALQALERMHYIAIGDAINKSAQGLLGIALALVGFGVVGFAGCLLATAAVAMVLSIRWLRRLERLEFRTSLRDCVALARGSAAYWTSGLFFTIYLWIDTAMLALMTNAKVVGWYGVATKLFQTALFVAVLASTAWLPRLVAAFQRSPRELHREARVPIDLVVSLALPIAAVIAFAAGTGVRLVYGPAYRNAVAPLIILSCCLAPMYLNIMLAQVCVASQRMRMWAWMMAGATIFNPVVNAILIPATQARWGNGAIGASVSLLLTEIAIAVAALRVIGLDVFSRSGVLRLLRVTVASAGAVGVSVACGRWGGAAALAGGSVALVVLAVVLRTMSREEVAFVRGRLVMVWGRLLAAVRRGLACLGAS